VEADNMNAVVVGGSQLIGPLDEDAVRRFDLVVAVDAGADALRSVGIVPHIFVGDMDSVSASTAAAFKQAGVETHTLSPAKDETDTEVALRLVRERGAGDITVLGVLGGPRLDHLLAAVFLLEAPWLEGATVRLLDDGNEIRLSPGRAELFGRPGDLVSLLSLDAAVEGVHTEGLEYPLRGETLRRAEGRGVSNVLVGDRAVVQHDSGRLLITHFHREAASALETAPATGAVTDPAAGAGGARQHVAELPAVCQFSIYPLEQPDIGPPIRAAIGEAAAAGVAAAVGRLATFLEGEQERVFRSLQAAFTRARESGPTVMVAILASGAPSAETVAAIQADKVEHAERRDVPEEGGKR
jgi:thiamine pyrophosphokinase